MAESWNKIFGKIDKIEGWLVTGQEKVLYDLASGLKRNSTIVEIGSFRGRSTACLALGRKDESIRIYAIDTFEGNNKDFLRGRQFNEDQFLDSFEENMKRLGVKNVIPIQGYSQEIGRKWKRPIDLLFIDGSHLHEDVKRDFELFYPWVKPGGLVLFHDVCPAFPGVMRVWQEIAKNKLSHINNFRTLYFGNKHKPYKIFVILPVHNRLKYTKRCLASLERQRYKNFEVIVVDDGSSDGTKEYLAEKFSWTVIYGDGNWWWTKSVYKGVEEAMKRAGSGDYVLTMNNDCFFKSNYLDNMIKVSQENKKLIIGSLILDAENPRRVVDAGVKISWKNNLIYGIADKISRNIKFYRDRKVIKVDTLPGKGTLIPVEVFNKIGNFNYRRLPHYMADYEFFCRAKRNGFRLIVSNKVRLYNFAKLTGIQEKIEPGIKGLLSLLFDRKSKSNVVDRINFMLLCCPRKYLWRNIRKILARLWYFYSLRLWWYRVRIKVKQGTYRIIYPTRLWRHRVELKLRQHPHIGVIFDKSKTN